MQITTDINRLRIDSQETQDDVMRLFENLEEWKNHVAEQFQIFHDNDVRKGQKISELEAWCLRLQNRLDQAVNAPEPTPRSQPPPTTTQPFPTEPHPMGDFNLADQSSGPPEDWETRLKLSAQMRTPVTQPIHSVNLALEPVDAVGGTGGASSSEIKGKERAQPRGNIPAVDAPSMPQIYLPHSIYLEEELENVYGGDQAEWPDQHRTHLQSWSTGGRGGGLCAETPSSTYPAQL